MIENDDNVFLKEGAEVFGSRVKVDPEWRAVGGENHGCANNFKGVPIHQRFKFISLYILKPALLNHINIANKNPNPDPGLEKKLRSMVTLERSLQAEISLTSSFLTSPRCLRQNKSLVRTMITALLFILYLRSMIILLKTTMLDF